VTDVTAAPVSRVRWSRAVRLIRSIYPPIELFEDVSDPAEWPAVMSLEQKFNPRLTDTIGTLKLVPENRRVGGLGSSYLMAPFTHVSPDRPSRFAPLGRGALYAAKAFETALAETVFHFEAFMRRTRESQSIEQFREVVLRIDARLHDIRSADADWTTLLDPSDYTHSRQAADRLLAAGSDGIVYPSVRLAGDECVALFYPNVAKQPLQARHFDYHWNGERVDWVRDSSTRQVYVLGHLGRQVGT